MEKLRKLSSDYLFWEDEAHYNKVHQYILNFDLGFDRLELLDEYKEIEYAVYECRAQCVMRESNLLKAYQMLDYFVTDEVDVKERSIYVIRIFDLLKEHENKLKEIVKGTIGISEPLLGELEMCYRLYDVCKEYHTKYEYIRGLIEDAQIPLNEVKQSPTLPKELNTPKAIKVFDKAIKEGYITPKGNFYQWHLSNVLLAYLCGRLYSGDFIHNSKYKNDEYKQGDLTFPDTAIEKLFYDKAGKPLKNIRKSRSGIYGSPRGYRNIDRLFEEAAE